MNLKNRMKHFKCDYGLVNKSPCSDEEARNYIRTLESGEMLPDDVVSETSDGTRYFFNIAQNDLTKEEETQYLQFKQLELLKTIKNYLFFFVVLACIGIGIGVILFFVGMMN
jgi:hypothetical protein